MPATAPLAVRRAAAGSAAIVLLLLVLQRRRRKRWVPRSSAAPMTGQQRAPLLLSAGKRLQ
jgi:hypothetical protein